MAGGAPTKHKEEYNEQARKLCLLGYTDAELADFFNVEESTINNWKIKHPEFLESVNAGKDSADADIADSLNKRAKGFTYKKAHIYQHNGEIISKEFDEYVVPDTRAIQYWLNNRQRRRWQSRQIVENKEVIEDVTFSPPEKIREESDANSSGNSDEC